MSAQRYWCWPSFETRDFTSGVESPSDSDSDRCTLPRPQKSRRWKKSQGRAESRHVKLRWRYRSGWDVTLLKASSSSALSRAGGKSNLWWMAPENLQIWGVQRKDVNIRSRYWFPILIHFSPTGSESIFNRILSILYPSGSTFCQLKINGVQVSFVYAQCIQTEPIVSMMTNITNQWCGLGTHHLAPSRCCVCRQPFTLLYSLFHLPLAYYISAFEHANDKALIQAK